MKHILLLGIFFTCHFTYTIAFQLNNFLRVYRSSSSSDLSVRHSKPELKASHENEFTILKCTVNNPQPNADVFISCPAIDSRAGSGYCYQGCQPTKQCPKYGDPNDKCLPNESTVFCEKMQLSNGTIFLTLRINRKDPRLVGTWSCTHAGLESTKFEVAIQKEQVKEEVPLHQNPVSEFKEEMPVENAAPSYQQTKEKHLDIRSLAYLRRPPVLFSVLAVLVLSLVINLAFCIRCMLMRSYIDASQEGSSQANCLAACLCLPKEMRKTQVMRMTPILPRSNWGTQPNLNGSYQGSAQLLYPSASMQKVPILIGQQSPNELSGIFYPGGSLSGTLRKQQQQRVLMTPPQFDAFNNPQMSYQTVSQDNTDPFRNLMNEMGGATSFLPQYIRAPSVNAPSPNLSNRLPPAPGTNNIYQTQNMVDGTGGQQYYLRMPAPIMGGHVIYDDVAAGNSSVLNAYCRNPNENLADHTTLQLPAIYQVAPMVVSSCAENTPLLSGSAQITSLHDQPITQPILNNFVNPSTPKSVMDPINVSSGAPMSGGQEISSQLKGTDAEKPVIASPKMSAT